MPVQTPGGMQAVLSPGQMLRGRAVPMGTPGEVIWTPSGAVVTPGLVGGQPMRTPALNAALYGGQTRTPPSAPGTLPQVSSPLRTGALPDSEPADYFSIPFERN